jgi:hypothetical protein
MGMSSESWSQLWMSRSWYAAAGALPQNVNWAIKSDYLLDLLSMVAGESRSRQKKQKSAWQLSDLDSSAG